MYFLLRYTAIQMNSIESLIGSKIQLDLGKRTFRIKVYAKTLTR